MNKIIAHKGDSWNYPENSKEAIQKGFELPQSDGVELDVRMTKDHKLIVRHDMSPFATSKGLHFRKINEMTLKELQELELTSHKIDWYKFLIQTYQDKNNLNRDELLRKLKALKKSTGKILTLKEAIQMIPEGKELIIEIKGDDDDYHSDVFRNTILELLTEYQNKNIKVKGYATSMLLWMKEQNPNLSIGTLVDKNLDSIHMPFDFVSININRLANNMRLIRSCSTYHQKPRELYVWTIDYDKQMTKIQTVENELGHTPNIITNNPEMIARYKEKRKILDINRGFRK